MDTENRLHLYKEMLRIRRFEETVRDLSMAGRIPLVCRGRSNCRRHLCQFA